jgi:hypothetical protein
LSSPFTPCGASASRRRAGLIALRSDLGSAQVGCETVEQALRETWASVTPET